MKSQASITCCFIIINLFSAFIAKSQTPEFEGIVTYKVEVKSKAAELPDRVMKSMLAAGI